jgi:hypothetical protein
VTKNDDHRSRGSSLLAAAMTIRSIRVRRGRLTPRQRTVSWWRSTAFSISRARPPDRPPATRSHRRTTA